MKSTKLVKRLIAIAATIFVMLLAGGFFFLSAEVEDEVLENRFGDVPWSHELHAREAVKNCQACHHKSKAGDPNPKPCSACHEEPETGDSIFAHIEVREMLAAKEKAEKKKQGERKAPKRRVSFHKSCQGCHLAVKEGPTACRDCHMSKMYATGGATEYRHRAYSDLYRIECTRCHEEGKPARTDSKGMNACRECHDEGYQHVLWENDIQVNHDPLFSGEAGIVEWDHRAHNLYYADYLDTPYECTTCHHQEKAETPKQAYRSCGACHKESAKRVEELGKVAPPRSTALHTRCLDCHDYRGIEGIGAEPTDCSGCHDSRSHVMDSNWGRVTWSHDGHGKGKGMDCQQCHHADDPGEERACEDCHYRGEFKDHRKLRAYTDTLCLRCHNEVSKAPNPLDAEKTAKSSPNLCTGCHADPTGQKVKLTDFPKKHQKLSMEKVMHALCIGCHEKEKKGPLQNDCRGCHAYPFERLLAQRAIEKEKELEEIEALIDEDILPATKPDPAMPKPVELMPSMKGFDPIADETHRLHVDMGGFPCADCHHNMIETAGFEEKYASLKKKTGEEQSNKLSCSMDAAFADCEPTMRTPQHCLSCHQEKPSLNGVPSYKQARKTLCTDCHKEFGIQDPPL